MSNGAFVLVEENDEGTLAELLLTRRPSLDPDGDAVMDTPASEEAVKKRKTERQRRMRGVGRQRDRRRDSQQRSENPAELGRAVRS